MVAGTTYIHVTMSFAAVGLFLFCGAFFFGIILFRVCHLCQKKNGGLIAVIRVRQSQVLFRVRLWRQKSSVHMEVLILMQSIFKQLGAHDLFGRQEKWKPVFVFNNVVFQVTWYFINFENLLYFPIKTFARVPQFSRFRFSPIVEFWLCKNSDCQFERDLASM